MKDEGQFGRRRKYGVRGAVKATAGTARALEIKLQRCTFAPLPYYAAKGMTHDEALKL